MGLDNMLFYDQRAFKVHNFKYVDDAPRVILESISVLLGEYSSIEKQAAILILKALLTKDFFHEIMHNSDLYPMDRGDTRVYQWRKLIKSRGFCENCGSTENLEAHHIIKWADYPKGRLDPNNGVCLCLKCHINEHKLDQSFYLMKGKYDAKAHT